MSRARNALERQIDLATLQGRATESIVLLWKGSKYSVFLEANPLNTVVFCKGSCGQPKEPSTH